MIARLRCWIFGHVFAIYEPEVGGVYLVCPRCGKDASHAYTGGDQGWLEAHAALRELHILKSETYGSETDALANYVDTSEQWADCHESTAARRIDEKMTRARNMILAGRADEVEEWPDIAGLALGAEALRRRRL